MSSILFDIGGTNMRVSSGELESVVIKKTPQDPDEGIELLLRLSKSVAGGVIKSVRGGVAGVVAIDGSIAGAAPSMAQWEGARIGEVLEKEITRDVKIVNDAEAAALGEAHFGAGKGFAIVAYIGVGTGIGGAKVVDGHIDPRTIGFEPGHHYLDFSDKTTFEEMVSGRAFEKKYGMHPRDIPRNAYDALTPTLAAGLHNAISFWSPEVLVLGGSMMNEENGFRVGDVTRALLGLQKVVKTPPEIKKSELGDLSGLFGAKSLLQGGAFA